LATPVLRGADPPPLAPQPPRVVGNRHTGTIARVPPRRGPSSGALIALTLLGVLAVAALGVGLYLASKPQLSAVPQLVGLTSAQAQIKLEQAKLNGKSTTVAGNCDKDKVISQDP